MCAGGLFGGKPPVQAKQEVKREAPRVVPQVVEQGDGKDSGKPESSPESADDGECEQSVKAEPVSGDGKRSGGSPREVGVESLDGRDPPEKGEIVKLQRDLQSILSSSASLEKTVRSMSAVLQDQAKRLRALETSLARCGTSVEEVRKSLHDQESASSDRCSSLQKAMDKVSHVVQDALEEQGKVALEKAVVVTECSRCLGRAVVHDVSNAEVDEQAARRRRREQRREEKAREQEKEDEKKKRRDRVDSNGVKREKHRDERSSERGRTSGAARAGSRRRGLFG